MVNNTFIVDISKLYLKLLRTKEGKNWLTRPTPHVELDILFKIIDKHVVSTIKAERT